MNNFWAVADEDIRKGAAVTFDPVSGKIRNVTQSDVEKKAESEKGIGIMESWGDPSTIKPLFRVSVNKLDRSFRLIQENITLTEEQARQIYEAYKNHNELG